jgi:outer membrane murein-binding lipoprotein Lpp
MWLVLGALILFGAGGIKPARAEDQTELQQLKQQVQELQQRIHQLEEAQAQQQEAEASRKEAEAKKPEAVQVGTKGSKVKVDGRLFAGVFDTGSDGAFPNRSLDIPDAKLRFTFSPSKDITIVNRFSTNRAATSGFDYFYLDLNNLAGAAGHTLRLGKMKIDVGDETWSDNPVESVLITNSVSHVSGYDEGVNFRGPLGRGKRPATYSLAVLNGNKDFVASDGGLAWAVKVAGAPTDHLYLSASYLATGDLVKKDGTLDKPDFKVGELVDAPGGATSWKRSLWEVDARWNYGPTGSKPTIVSEPTPRFQAAAAYGQFTDAAAPVADRQGKYWFLEGLYNLIPRLFLASRYSTVELDDGATAKLGDSPVAVNAYHRFALGVGYRLTSLTQIKAEWTRNRTSGGGTQPHLDQLAVGVATKF